MLTRQTTAVGICVLRKVKAMCLLDKENNNTSNYICGIRTGCLLVEKDPHFLVLFGHAHFGLFCLHQHCVKLVNLRAQLVFKIQILLCRLLGCQNCLVLYRISTCNKQLCQIKQKSEELQCRCITKYSFLTNSRYKAFLGC